MKDLQGDVALKSRVVGPIDFAHATRAEARDDAVAVDEISRGQ